MRAHAHDGIDEFGGGVDETVFRNLASLLTYINGDYEDPTTYVALRRALENRQRPLHSFAIPPAMFPVVVRGLAAAGCTEGARVVVEKPFGRGIESAQSLNATLYEALPESGIFRIDHYLGKEAVQNILYFRFANSFLEPIWNRNHIRQIQITMSENFGVAGRGRFYDSVGAIRDVLQNHLLQILVPAHAPVAHRIHRAGRTHQECGRSHGRAAGGTLCLQQLSGRDERLRASAG